MWSLTIRRTGETCKQTLCYIEYDRVCNTHDTVRTRCKAVFSCMFAIKCIKINRETEIIKKLVVWRMSRIKQHTNKIYIQYKIERRTGSMNLYLWNTVFSSFEKKNTINNSKKNGGKIKQEKINISFVVEQRKNKQNKTKKKTLSDVWQIFSE